MSAAQSLQDEGESFVDAGPGKVDELVPEAAVHRGRILVSGHEGVISRPRLVKALFALGIIGWSKKTGPAGGNCCAQR